MRIYEAIVKRKAVLKSIVKNKIAHRVEQENRTKGFDLQSEDFFICLLKKRKKPKPMLRAHEFGLEPG